MGTQGTENCEFGPEYRTGTGIVYGLRWAQAHPHYDLSHTRWKALRDLATASQTLSGWRAQMTSAEGAWFDAQPAAAQAGIFAMAIHSSIVISNPVTAQGPYS